MESAGLQRLGVGETLQVFRVNLHAGSMNQNACGPAHQCGADHPSKLRHKASYLESGVIVSRGAMPLCMVAVALKTGPLTRFHQVWSSCITPPAGGSKWAAGRRFPSTRVHENRAAKTRIPSSAGT